MSAGRWQAGVLLGWVVLAGAACSRAPLAFDKPTDVAVAPGGDFYVSDGYGNTRVARFKADGTYLSEWGGSGDGPGEFDTPHGIAVGPDGRVYVADRDNARIQVFDADGAFLTEWKGPDIGRPWGLTLGRDGYLYVIDGGDQDAEHPRARALKLDLEGRVVARWGSHGQGPGQFDWGHDIAVDSKGNVYVVDVRGKRVQKFRAP
ncbi:hypothetical protein HPC49_45680 [Pyxidicoccus fallax]|uniref:6-bladed beta-propeller n=1 Tax=Pyxidicoccus fallax TaxID=394095 RepID=A0A848LZM3_9BACT|nr:peptidyl-alpha-hydroxyglycine alpha-amidating lyase family protein [Pyxidicoccus fallax]NMO22982.1 hypothetical protein [Pyxidicoccus fallax]NPC85472.1 hypothetical protein [Pyxidicoccus fallax]